MVPDSGVGMVRIRVGHGHVRRGEPFHARVFSENAAPQAGAKDHDKRPQPTLCVSLRSGKVHGDVIRVIAAKIFK